MTKAELMAQLEEARREIAYYRRFAENAGNIRLRETEELSRLIADRRRAEEALKESEEKFRMLLEFLPISIFEMDGSGHMTFANPFALKSTGFVMEDIERGLHFLKGARSSDRGKTFNLSKGETEGFEYIVRRKDGSKFPAHIRTRPNIRNGETVGLMGYIFDLSDLKNAEKALRESETKYRALVEQSTEGIVVALANPIRLAYANTRMADITGYSVDELTSFSPEQLAAHIHPEDRGLFFKRFKARISGKNPKGEREIRALRKDRTEIVLSVTSKLIEYNGEPAAMTLLDDITEKKNAEREKADLENRLKRAEKMEAIGTLAGGVAHDLNNILSGIVSYPDLLLMDLPDDSPMKNPLRTIRNAGKKSADIVQDLLTLARRGVAINQVLNLNDIVNEYLHSPEYEKLKSYHPNVEIESNLESGLLNIMGSSVHLSKTIMNLVSNAAEAIDGDGRVAVSTRNQYVDARKKGYENVEEGDYVVLSVADNGMGISAQDLDKIFEPFYTKKVMGRSGTGLGMAVVWGTVKDHKGFIDVCSAEGDGTAFDLYFPATREAVEDVPGLRIGDYAGNGETVLIVDDVEEQRKITSLMLSRLGYRPLAVSSGEEAVEFLKNQAVDLLLLDMIMDPGMDGLDTYRQILELHPGQRAVIASGFTETDRVKEAIRLGAGKYIRKPYTLEKIGIAIREELSGRPLIQGEEGPEG